MTLIVEDGTAMVAAEAYCDVAYADKYHTDRGELVWPALDVALKEAYLRKATDFLTQRYRALWLGYRVTITQRLDWPRYDVPIYDTPGGYRGFPAVYAFNIVPEQVKQASAELALRTSQGLTLSPDLKDSVKSKKVGPIEVVYERGSRGIIEFSSVDDVLRPLLGARNSFPVRRA